jgi:general secretion pathway protein G
MKIVRRRKTDKGFTIVELLVVIVIISLLAVFVAPKMLTKVGRAKRDLAAPQIALVEGAIQSFALNCDRLPVDLYELLEEPADLEGTNKWSGPYLKRKQIIDPWGNEFQYFEEGMINPGSFDIISIGADGEEGGEGDNADIYNDE